MGRTVPQAVAALAILLGLSALTTTNMASEGGQEALPLRQLAGDLGTPGAPGPSAAGAPVNPHELPALREQNVSPEAHEIPRLYPVDQAIFERMKAQANAEAASNTTKEEEAP